LQLFQVVLFRCRWAHWLCRSAGVQWKISLWYLELGQRILGPLDHHRCNLFLD
jgi:hypothetical protein